MKRIRINKIVTLFSLLTILMAHSQANGQSRYQKLFENKKSVVTAKGLITMHIIDGKLYLELPNSIMGKSLLMSTVVDNSSNLQMAYVGQRTSKPLHISFSKTDSLVQIRSNYPPQIIIGDDKGVQNAIKESSLPPIINSSPIVAWSADSSAVLFDATSFFVSGSKYIGNLNVSSMGGFMQMISTFSKDLSSIKSIKAFDNSVSIISDMTYTLKTYMLGMESKELNYLTAELKTTLSLLPQEPFESREADYRIGTDVTQFSLFDLNQQGSKEQYFANRWRVEPADKEAYYKGEITKAEHPIIFYVDTLFAPSWREAIKRGLTKWNRAFEAAGFKEVIEVREYPTRGQDSLFDASNIRYNTVQYAQIASRNIVHQVNTDPRTGEIISASILFFRDSPITLQRERLYQTAQVEPDVRSYKLPDHLMCDAIELAMTREMGFCLGLTANYAASSWMEVDSLRSPTFTQKEGITSSVMDQIRYNYVARPGDIARGVKLTADQLGSYDLYAINWLYRLYPQGSNQKALLSKIIEERAGDRRFLYGKQQNWAAYFDPRSTAEDLGNDKIKATKYGVETLKYISRNSAQWINKDEVDDSYRELFVDFIFLKLHDYYRSLMVNIGGIESNPRYQGDPLPSTTPVSREVQKSTLKYMLEQLEDLTWLDEPELLMMSGMNKNLSTYYANNLMALPLQRIPMVAFTQQKSNNPYSVDEMLGDLLLFSLKNIKKGEAPNDAQRAALYQVTQLLLNNSALPVVERAKENKSNAFTLVQPGYPNNTLEIFQRSAPELLATEGEAYSSFEVLKSVKYLVSQDLSPLYYKHLMVLKDELKSALKRVKEPQTKASIEYLIETIKRAEGI